ncbi:adenosylcobinamide-GDP ribazoletransferase [Paracoccus sp. Z330]|uniref:Adenosylcobinamide-GDP ribazoletransferase n=1 Tax=Paracoccus onchidii TaxID=3017813 RepID=A0ABT4ZIK4_9RHOB|nr:adenosylcobinamide-GDP ribazoletransferase [Paracoccus onchidii]MDB6179189.1 adenosylcobinamide-GDP ribazoletransferase [Paracoccus onchidii]
MARLHQFVLAAVFLTRLPLARFLPTEELAIRDSIWAFPLVGALIGLLAGLPLWIDGPELLLAAMSLALSVLLTGSLHEDGLADFADSAGGRDRDARLAIMRDSRIGSYGVMALILTSGLRLGALAAIGNPLVLVAAAVCGRAAIVLTMAALLPARSDGLGWGAGRPGWRLVILATLLALLGLLIAGDGLAAAATAALLMLAVVIRQARVWLGGQTGDVLGAASVLVETAVLCAFALVLAGQANG